jgi:hypothetical protein
MQARYPSVKRSSSTLAPFEVGVQNPELRDRTQLALEIGARSAAGFWRP